MYKFSKRSLERMEGVDQRLLDIAHKAISISKIDFGIPKTGGLRTASQQNELFIKGLSQLDGVSKLSKHQSGKALDIYAYVDGKASWDPGYLAQVACAFFQASIDLGYDIEWGGLWKVFIDGPHFELKES